VYNQRPITTVRPQPFSKKNGDKDPKKYTCKNAKNDHITISSETQGGRIPLDSSTISSETQGGRISLDFSM
jgi:hypothetical protein